jgi:hypothetical protein
MAVDDYAAFGSRLSIRLRSASKSMGLVSSASAPPANAFRSVSASPVQKAGKSLRTIATAMQERGFAISHQGVKKALTRVGEVV